MRLRLPIKRERDKCRPEYWFLPLNRRFPVLRARSNRWNKQYHIKRRAFTSYNQVIPHIDGAAYMRALADDFSSMTAGDVLYMIGWRFKSSIKLVGTNDILNALHVLIQKNVDVRALVHKAILPPFINWDDNPILKSIVQSLFYSHPAENEAFVNSVNLLGGAAILDDQLPRKHKMAAHHQKAVVLSVHQAHKAYVGGIDIAPDRWDTPAHNKTMREEYFGGWHDIQCSVTGDAVQQIWANFADRWNEKAAQPSRPERYQPLSLSSVPPAGEKRGTQHVQVLRTLACDKTFSFAPKGEQSLRRAYKKAIQRAEHYIYIEDQCFYSCEICELLLKRLRQVKDLKIIVVTSVETDLPTLINQHHYYLRDQFFETLLGSNAFGDSSRVYAFSLQQSASTAEESLTGEGFPIYVHSKLLIVDDRYVCLGSGNVNWRSLTTDTELNIAVVDESVTESRLKSAAIPVCKFAKDLRVRLWAEHLGKPEAEIASQTLAETIAQFPKQPEEQVGHLRPLARNPGRRLTAESIALQVIPEGLATFLKSTLYLFGLTSTNPAESGDTAAEFFLQEMDPMMECPSARSRYMRLLRRKKPKGNPN